MKRNHLFLTLGAVFATLAGTYNVFSKQSPSLSDFSAHAGSYCTSASNSDCQSSSTGNIYVGYKAK